MELAGNGNAAILAAFLSQMWARLSEPLGVIRDNSPACRGDALQACLTTAHVAPALGEPALAVARISTLTRFLGWVRQEVTANLCPAARDEIQDRVGEFFAVRPRSGLGRKN